MVDDQSLCGSILSRSQFEEVNSVFEVQFYNFSFGKVVQLPFNYELSIQRNYAHPRVIGLALNIDVIHGGVWTE
jgi:hypothetical protein